MINCLDGIKLKRIYFGHLPLYIRVSCISIVQQVRPRLPKTKEAAEGAYLSGCVCTLQFQKKQLLLIVQIQLLVVRHLANSCEKSNCMSAHSVFQLHLAWVHEHNIAATNRWAGYDQTNKQTPTKPIQ